MEPFFPKGQTTLGPQWSADSNLQSPPILKPGWSYGDGGTSSAFMRTEAYSFSVSLYDGLHCWSQKYVSILTNNAQRNSEKQVPSPPLYGPWPSRSPSLKEDSLRNTSSQSNDGSHNYTAKETTAGRDKANPAPETPAHRRSAHRIGASPSNDVFEKDEQ